MNVKSLVLGSAALLVAVGGARAADPIMAPEPEPVEYVRICDAYGAGFFYIPGTETCLQISGYVWYQIGFENWSTATQVGVDGDTRPYYHGPGATVPPGWNDPEGWYKTVRARLNVDARSETEWGTLRSYIRLQASWNGVGDGPVFADQAYIMLGGLMMGYSESFWADSKNGGPSNYGSHSWGGLFYGYQQRALIGYRFDANGFFGAISLEDDTLADEGYLPDVVAKIGYTGGWGTVWLKAAYDESFENTVGVMGPNDGGFAAQLGVQLNVPNMPGSSLRVIGFYADGDHAYGSGAPGVVCVTGACAPPTLLGQSEWSVLVSYNHQFSATLGASVGFQYFNDLYIAGTDSQWGVDAWAAELSVVWFPVPQFEVRGEVVYTDVGSLANVPGGAGVDPDGTFSGYLRFTRYF